MGKGTLNALNRGMRRDGMERNIALDSTKTDIASRIRPVCTHFTDAEFVELVERMAEIDVRYRFRDDWVFGGDREFDSDDIH